MSEYKKFPFQEFQVSSECSEFVGVSICTPVESSFYLSLGIALVESLIRLKSHPECTNATWNAFEQYRADASKYAARQN